MTKVYQDYADLHVAKTYIYDKTGDDYAYSDSAKTVKINAATLKNLFLKGAVILGADSIEYLPVSFRMESTVGIVTYVKTNGTTATVADLAVLKSSEFAG